MSLNIDVSDVRLKMRSQTGNQNFNQVCVKVLNFR